MFDAADRVVSKHVNFDHHVVNILHEKSDECFLFGFSSIYRIILLTSLFRPTYFCASIF